MKDYTLDVDCEKDFITSYEKDEKSIVIYYADGNFKEIANNRQNEIDILKRMKWQVKFYGEEMKEQTELFINFLANRFNCCGKMAMITSIVGVLIENGIIIYSSLGFLLGCSTAILYKIKDEKKYQSDYEKNNYYLTYEEIFNDKNISNIISSLNISENTKDRIQTNNFNINSLDDVSFRDLKKIIKEYKKTKKR